MLDVGTHAYTRDIDGNGPLPQTGGVVDHRDAPQDHGVFADIMRRIVASEKKRLQVLFVEDHGSSNTRLKDQWRHGSIMHKAEAWVHGEHRHLLVSKWKVSDDGIPGRRWKEKYLCPISGGDVKVTCR